MKNCEDCGITIGDQYTYCSSCANKRKANKTTQSDQVAKELSAINNNLYFLRRAAEIQIREQFGKKIIWDKTKKDFIEKGAGD